MTSSLLLALVLVAASALSALAALMLAAWLQGRRDARPVPVSDAVFLLQGRAVIDANVRGSALLAALARVPGGDTPLVPGDALDDGWEGLMAWLSPSFPDLSARLCRLSARDGRGLDEAEVLGAADGSGLRLTLQPAPGGEVRLRLHDRGQNDPATEGQDTLLVDRLSWRAMRDEVELLRRITDLAPTPVWRESPDGQIIWANGAYLRLLREIDLGRQLVWPLPRLFPPGAGSRPDRVSLVAAGQRGRHLWFDVTGVGEGADRIVFAIPADEAQKAERTRNEFVQTLTKTFATLPVGLAVFDRQRRLHLFNPALADLTRLEPEFLASRPGVEGFLNRMRDKRILPEPRDYRAWTRRFIDSAAPGAAGFQGFEETWALADGRSFRVSASPHPDGALAILIEDITADIHLKRSFRAELDTGQSALDMVDTAVAMFSSMGDLVLTNAAFDRLWMLEGAETLAGVRLPEAIANWRAAGDDTHLWDRIAALAARNGPGAGAEVEGPMRLADGEVLRVTARPAPNGGLMIAFRPVEIPPAPTPLPVRARATA